jgi:uncharacterized protein (DUF58 family)
MKRLLYKYINKQTILILLSVIFLFSAWNRAIDMLYAVFSLILATLLLAYLLPRKALHEVTATRIIPASAFEDDVINMDVVLENQGWRDRYMIEVIDAIPAAVPSLQTPMSFIAKLPGGKKREYAMHVQCYKRGKYTIGPITLRSAYPLGISAIEHSIPETQPKLTVYPKVFEISHLPFFSATNMPSSSAEAMAKSGGSEEFFGTREYRQGDSIKYIHWRSTAKYSKLIVKEFEIRCTSEISIILDLQQNASIGTGRESTLEYSIKLAASIAKYALEHGHTIQLIGFGDQFHVVPYARGIDKLSHVLDMLACVNDNGKMNYPEAIMHAADYMRDGGQAVLFISSKATLDDYAHSFGLLKSKRIKPMTIFMDADSFRDKQATNAFSLKDQRLPQELISNAYPVYFVAKGDSLSEVFG